jgi:murein DD-endopeptidase MepM/ murein hydrolase activator NlpD
MLPIAAFILALSTRTAAPPPRPPSSVVTKQVTGLTIQVDTAWAHPGGVLVATVRSRRGLGPASFALEGRRARLYPGRGGLRTLVPVPVTMHAGPATLGLEIRGRRGRRRIPVEVEIAPAAFTPRVQAIPESKRPLLERPERVRDSRVLLEALRTETPQAYARGPLVPPVPGEPYVTFGGLETYEGASFVPLLMDGIYGDHHRGVDYAVAVGTPVRAPGAGIVTLAQSLALTGQTLVVDHGHGVHSTFFHLSRLDVTVGQVVEAGALLGGSGDSGLTTTPHLHWGVYVHGVAVDPRALLALDLG